MQAGLLFLMAASANVGCRARDANPLPIDLIALLPQAERRAAGSVDDAVRADSANVDGSPRPVLITRAPARVIWPLRFGSKVVLRSRVSLLPDASSSSAGVIVRVGISDERSYDELLRTPLDRPGWRPIEIDLSAYSGWQWSLFYQPSRVTWRLVINADATPGGTMAWADLRIEKKRRGGL
jgi:hypothetical protein